MKKAVKAILNVLSYGGIEVESARRLADIKKLDPIRIFLRKLDMEIYNGDYKVPIRLFFPDEKMEEHGAKEAILFFHGSCRCSGSSGILEGKRAVVTNAADHIQCFQKIFFGLTRETNDNICSQGNIRYGITDLVYKFQILFFVITAVHDL